MPGGCWKLTALSGHDKRVSETRVLLGSFIVAEAHIKMCGFKEAKIAYVVARKQQRSKIRDSPKQAGFKVKISGSAGQGICKYTSGKHLDSPFDLSNWMWVESGRDSVLILVTLQVLDQDPKSLHTRSDGQNRCPDF